MAAISTDVWISVGSGLLISLVAFTALILAPAVGAFGRTGRRRQPSSSRCSCWSPLVLVGVALGALIVLHWDQITGLVK